MTRVLVVDDIAENRYLLEAVLKRNGYEVTSARNGAEALLSARQDPPDLIITDILMPVMDGFELCRQWKADDRLQRVPLIFYTATYTDSKDEAFALSLGAERFLVKPLKTEVLSAAVREVLEAKRPPNPGAASSPDATTEVLRQYNEVLFHKLEQKIEQLEAEVAERRRAEEEVRLLNADLEKRVRQRTAELEDKNQELESFSYSVSHDLRAPLRAIEGFSDKLASQYGGALDDEGRRLLETVRRSTRNMSRLIDELLQFSRSGRIALKRKRLDMNAIVRSAFSQLIGPGDQERVDLRVADLPAGNGDPTLVGQVWTNLLSNALKFSSGREQAVIEVGSRDENGRVVYFVRDNGAGFDMKYADKLFCVFQRLHSPSEFPGVGVGLAIVHRIVSRHGGQVSGKGVVGEGAVFSFSL